MSEYTEQAINFLKAANATMTIELVGCDVPRHWKSATKRHNHYIFTITTPRGTIESDFWDSLFNTKRHNRTYDEFCKEESHALDRHYNQINPYPTRKQYADMKKETTATEYDILACLSKYPVGTFKEFCEEFGYDDDSIAAMRTWEGCREEYDALCRIFTPEQMEALQEIN